LNDWNKNIDNFVSMKKELFYFLFTIYAFLFIFSKENKEEPDMVGSLIAQSSNIIAHDGYILPVDLNIVCRQGASDSFLLLRNNNLHNETLTVVSTENKAGLFKQYQYLLSGFTPPLSQKFNYCCYHSPNPGDDHHSV
jgi:hypothetical protein